jgi:hypothetical protein
MILPKKHLTIIIIMIVLLVGAIVFLSIVAVLEIQSRNDVYGSTDTAEIINQEAQLNFSAIFLIIQEPCIMTCNGF